MPAHSAAHASTPVTPHRLSVDGIRAACRDIDPAFLDTPQFHAPALSERLGCAITLKDETVNPLGCFKGRGAECLLARSGRRGESGALVCASAGNFGLAMARACAIRGRALTVFVSRHASPVKVDGIRRHGARVIVEGEDFDAAKCAARIWARSQSLAFIEDGAEVDISEGAGTVALELLSEGAAFDAILVPLGNGALLAGMARYVKSVSPGTEMIGVCSAGAPVMHDCWKRGVADDEAAAAHAMSIADGIAVRVPVAAAVLDLQGIVDDVVLVEDAELLAAMRSIRAHAGILVEPSGAAGLAAIAADPSRFAGRQVATVLTGANLTRDQVRRWLA